MNIHWLKVLVAAFFEVLWVIGLAHADNILLWIVTIVAIVVSNYLLIASAQALPAGTVYAVFVGLGAAGAVISEILFFGEPFKLVKIFLIALLLTGVIGLKFVTDEEERQEVRE